MDTFTNFELFQNSLSILEQLTLFCSRSCIVQRNREMTSDSAPE